MPKLSALLIPLLLTLPIYCGSSPAAAQALSSGDRVIASVPSADASSAGVLAVSGGKNLLGGASVVTALDHTAHVTLWRGGEMLVCQTSAVHLTATNGILRLVGRDDPLLISLDRGAMEVHMPITSDDAIITPDLRFTAPDADRRPDPLDLAIRVASNGDTCVENRGRKAPLLQIADSFGQSSYQLKPGQHVLFEHGSLTEVVDRETSPCGCPPTTPKSIPLADALLRGGASKPPTPKQLDKAYPFPAAASEGLAPPTPLPPEAPGETHTQVSTTLTYNPADAPPAPTAAPEPVSSTPQPPLPAPTPTRSPGVFHSIGHFFKRVFVR